MFHNRLLTVVCISGLHVPFAMTSTHKSTLRTRAGSIIDFSQLNSGLVELTLSEFNVCHVIENCIDMVHAEAASKGLVVSSTFPRQVMTSLVVGDSLRIRQVLVHLLSNAVKFTDAGLVELVATASRSKDALSLTIKVCKPTCRTSNSCQRISCAWSGLKSGTCPSHAGDRHWGRRSRILQATPL